MAREGFELVSVHLFAYYSSLSVAAAAATSSTRIPILAGPETFVGMMKCIFLIIEMLQIVIRIGWSVLGRMKIPKTMTGSASQYQKKPILQWQIHPIIINPMTVLLMCLTGPCKLSKVDP